MKNKVFIIAEVGVNHNGNIDEALKYIDAAKKIGADAVKFQTYKSENVVTSNTPMADYQEVNLGKKITQLEMIQRYELSFDDFKYLFSYARKIGIQFISTAFDLESVDFLYKLGIRVWKIPSGEITNLPYLSRIASYAGKILISRGMASMEELIEAINILTSIGPKKDLTILHCVSEYPTPIDRINLKAISTIQKNFTNEVGLSDHSLETITAVGAVAMGAKVIEKHITFNRNLPGPDHNASLTVQEFEKMVKQIRLIERALGDGSLAITATESVTKNLVRKSIVAKKNIEIGEVFTVNNLDVKRPGNGMSPMRWNDVVGKASTKKYKENDLIDEDS
jgi:N,N'-diacetyllegionaminate synthase